MSHPIGTFCPQSQEAYNTTVYIPKQATRSNWLTCRNISIGTALILGVGAIGVTAYFTSKTFTETITNQLMSSNGTDPSNYSDPSINHILEIYENVRTVNLTECTPGFKNYWGHIHMGSQTLCDYVRYAINLFKNSCPDTSLDCPEVAKVMEDCQKFMSEEFPDC